jgi:hypothetical protein
VPKNIYLEVFNAGFCSFSRNKWFPLIMTSLIFGGLHFLIQKLEKNGVNNYGVYIGTVLF